jgi:hypothetical protein
MARPPDPKAQPFDNQKPTATSKYTVAGELRTTPTEYAKFMIEVIDPKGSDAFRLRRDALKEMLRPQVKLDEKARALDGASSWALGWGIADTEKGKVFFHSGGNNGFRSYDVASVERKSALHQVC